MSKTRKERLQDILNLLCDSLKRDEEMSKEIQSISTKKDQTPVIVNQNVGLQDLMGALKDCMVDTVVAMECVQKATMKSKSVKAYQG
uniref:Protein MON2 homolog n=1 Tax=Caenorhabditis tropicalis TaxID=1561998 RepID=A0A1I7V3H4_9PELO